MSPTESGARSESGGRKLLRKLEPFVWLAVALFALNRFGPQLTAWTGWGPPPRAEAAPELAVTTLDGTRLGPDELKGRVQVITFWATWCRVCRMELPNVQAVAEAWSGSDQVVVLGLSIDSGSPAQVAAHVRSFARDRGLTFPQALADNRLRWEFGGIPGVPTTFIVDSDGMIRHTLVGYSGPGTLRRAVERLVEDAGEAGAREAGAREGDSRERDSREPHPRQSRSGEAPTATAPPG